MLSPHNILCIFCHLIIWRKWWPGLIIIVRYTDSGSIVIHFPHCWSSSWCSWFFSTCTCTAVDGYGQDTEPLTIGLYYVIHDISSYKKMKCLKVCQIYDSNKWYCFVYVIMRICIHGHHIHTLGWITVGCVFLQHYLCYMDYICGEKRHMIVYFHGLVFPT